MRNPSIKGRPRGVGGPNADLPPWVETMLSEPEVEQLLQGAVHLGTFPGSQK